MQTIVDFACVKGVSSDSGERIGNLCCSGACNVDGSHSLQLRISVARSVTGSEIHLHSLGHGLPPKVRRSDINSSHIPSIQICVRDLTAVIWLRC